jgi:nitrite reductase/ring-hydroxylating ferredoxin subunit
MRLCHLDDLPVIGSRGFDPQHTGQDSLLLVRRGEQVFAYVDRCPHHDTPMAWRKDAYLNGPGDRIVCAAHGAQFEIDTGVCTLGPCLGQSLTALPLTRNAHGEVFLADPLSLETTP